MSHTRIEQLLPIEGKYQIHNKQQCASFTESQEQEVSSLRRAEDGPHEVSSLRRAEDGPQEVSSLRRAEDGPPR